jgi:hypothetical protein
MTTVPQKYIRDIELRIQNFTESISSGRHSRDGMSQLYVARAALQKLLQDWLNDEFLGGDA